MASSSKTLSQKEYLKKYLGKTKKKKSKSASSKVRTVKVVDDNIDSSRDHDNYDIESGEDAPVIAAIIDERPREIREMEYYNETNRWKPIENTNNDKRYDDFNSRKNGNEFLNRKEPSERDRKSYRNSSQSRRERPYENDLSPPRRRPADFDSTSPRKERYSGKQSEPDLSPPRRNRSSGKPYEPDLSPPRRNRSSGKPYEPNLSPARRNKYSERPVETDFSPPRKSRHAVRTSDPDLSPPRRNRNVDRSRDADFSPSSHRRNYDKSREIDMSPNRDRNLDKLHVVDLPSHRRSKMTRKPSEPDTYLAKRNRPSERPREDDLSPRRSRHSGDSFRNNLSPRRDHSPRRDRHTRDFSSPSRRKLNDKTREVSLPKSSYNNTHSRSKSPARIKWRMKNPTDSYANRDVRSDRRRSHSPSPRRKGEKTDDLSPPRKKKYDGRERDVSTPPRRVHQDSSPRRQNKDARSPPHHNRRDDSCSRRDHGADMNKEVPLSPRRDHRSEKYRQGYALPSRAQHNRESFSNRNDTSEEETKNSSLPRKHRRTPDLSPRRRRHDSKSPFRKNTYSQRPARDDSPMRDQKSDRKSKYIESPRKPFSDKLKKDTSRNERASSSSRKMVRLEKSTRGDSIASSQHNRSRAVGADYSSPRRRRFSPGRSSSPEEKRSKNVELNKKNQRAEGEDRGSPPRKSKKGKTSDDSSPVRKKEKSKTHKSKDKSSSKKHIDNEFPPDKKLPDNGVPEPNANHSKSIIYHAAGDPSKPLSRFVDDKDLNNMLREKERLEDPMFEYMEKKKRKKELKKGIVRRPEYQGAFPQNRFGIRPGHKWDGVDRSNGFEKKWFDKQGERKIMEQEAYKWGIEDM